MSQRADSENDANLTEEKTKKKGKIRRKVVHMSVCPLVHCRV